MNKVTKEKQRVFFQSNHLSQATLKMKQGCLNSVLIIAGLLMSNVSLNSNVEAQTIEPGNPNAPVCRQVTIRSGIMCGYEIWGSDFSVGKEASFYQCWNSNGTLHSQRFLNCL